MNNNSLVITILLVFICALIVFIFAIIKRGKTNANSLRKISVDLCKILDENTDEKIMLFTDDKYFIELNTQINRILEERQKMKADYRRAQLSTKRMLSNISHDIRTPMTVIQGYIEIMLMDNHNDIETLKKIESKTKQVTEMIRAFFTLSKIEAGDYPTNITRVHCNEVCVNSAIEFYDILTEKEFEVNIDIPKHEVFAYGDKEAIERIINNLISNVIRYGYEGKYLGLKLYTDEKSVYIEIIDKGKGIDKISAEHVFDRLYTVDDSRNKNIQGDGLGLTIAKELAQKMGGDVTLLSQPYTQTIFTIRLKKYNL